MCGQVDANILCLPVPIRRPMIVSAHNWYLSNSLSRLAVCISQQWNRTRFGSSHQPQNQGLFFFYRKPGVALVARAGNSYTGVCGHDCADREPGRHVRPTANSDALEAEAGGQAVAQRPRPPKPPARATPPHPPCSPGKQCKHKPCVIPPWPACKNETRLEAESTRANPFVYDARDAILFRARWVTVGAA